MGIGTGAAEQRRHSRGAGGDSSQVAAHGEAYDCFVSYARQPDEALAQAVRKGLAGLAKPWYRRRALRVFLDTTNLSASPELESALSEALSDSRFFILLASPEAAGRPWVDREVAWWREHRNPDNFLIADCGAGLRWDEALGDFAADARVPPSLRGWFSREPTWTDLSWARTEAGLTLRNPRFGGHVADLAAPLRKMSKDALVDEDLRQHRRSLRLAWSAAGTLLLLTVAAIAATALALVQRHQAIVERNRADAQASAALAEATFASDPLTSLNDATKSLAIESTPAGVRALRQTLAAPLRQVFHLNAHIGGLAFSPDGRLLAQAARGGVSLWNVRTGGLVPASARGPSFIADFSFDASGRDLAIVGQIGSVNVLQVAHIAGRSRSQTIQFGNLMDGAMSPDGTTVALANQAGTLALRRLGTDRTLVLDRHDAISSDLQFAPDGGHLLAIGGRGLEVWSVARPTTKVEIRSRPMVAARFTSNDTVVGVAGDGVTTTWTVDGRQLGQTRVSLGPDASVAISANGRLVAVGSRSSVVVWDLGSGQPRLVGNHPGGAITAMAFGPNDRSLASVAEGDTLIRIWDLETGPPRLTRGGGFYASIITASPGGALIAAIEDQGSGVAVWPRDGSRRRVFPGGDATILAAGFVPGADQILTFSDDGAARLIDAITGQRRVIRGGLGRADVAALSPDRRYVAVGRDGAPLRVWRLAGGPPVTIARITHKLDALSFSADGQIAGADGTRTVRVWNIRGGRLTRLTAPKAIDLVNFGPSRDRLAAGSETGGSVFLWRRLARGARPTLLGRHEHFVTAVAFSPDGSGVASAGDVGPVYLWPLDGGSGISLAESTAQETTALGFDPSGSTLAMSDGTLRVLSCEACGPVARLVAEAHHLESRGGLP